MRTLKDCKMITMERASGDWYCSIQSPISVITYIYHIHDSEKGAIEGCKEKWINEFNNGEK